MEILLNYPSGRFFKKKTTPLFTRYRQTEMAMHFLIQSSAVAEGYRNTKPPAVSKKKTREECCRDRQ
jgi:hypothetical protein